MSSLFKLSVAHQQVCKKMLTLVQWPQTQFLEGHSSAQCSSNPNQTHLIQLIRIFRIIRNFQAGVRCWS
ncbi:Potassium voltage-gated channel subfamily A member 3 [Labeo rohita]|uniref:Potassium voltage-gated channel subfamily A member 3 n=1 Tax=Labeo rohita TaxID=84645 RepID=A0ABQ8LKK0_LABRO|nr:Potassium voltage-gated channel subfamily A member 3 [Labeo rohita]